MRLLLTSNGLANKEIIVALQTLAGRLLTELSLAFIPTAANVEADDKTWLIEDLINCKKAGFAQIDIVDVAAMQKAQWLPRLMSADVILVGGGSSRYLFDQLTVSGLGTLLPELLIHKVYVGISAGSMVVCSNISRADSEKFFHEDLGGGLGLVDFWIKPHLNSSQFPERTVSRLALQFEETPTPVYALDDESAILINESVIEVVGNGSWRRYPAKSTPHAT